MESFIEYDSKNHNNAKWNKAKRQWEKHLLEKCQATHTSGPWKVTERDNCGDNIFAGLRRIANTYGSDDDPECKANAFLIAAAPEMYEDLKKERSINKELLEALEDILCGWRYIRLDPLHKSLYGVGWDRAQKKAEAAISKAKGGA